MLLRLPGAEVEVEEEITEKIVNIRPKAMDHLQELRRSQGEGDDIFLRMGVRSGGCSGLSYIMDLVKKVRTVWRYTSVWWRAPTAEDELEGDAHTTKTSECFRSDMESIPLLKVYRPYSNLETFEKAYEVQNSTFGG